MNKYIFPGADASCPLGWVVSHLESCGWEVKNVDVLGVHYSATIYHWYQNWVANRENVVKAYGEWCAYMQLLIGFIDINNSLNSALHRGRHL